MINLTPEQLDELKRDPEKAKMVGDAIEMRYWLEIRNYMQNNDVESRIYFITHLSRFFVLEVSSHFSFDTKQIAEYLNYIFNKAIKNVGMIEAEKRGE